MSTEDPAEAVASAIRKLAEALLNHRQGGIAAGPDLSAAQQALTDALRGALTLKRKLREPAHD